MFSRFCLMLKALWLANIILFSSWAVLVSDCLSDHQDFDHSIDLAIRPIRIFNNSLYYPIGSYGLTRDFFSRGLLYTIGDKNGLYKLYFMSVYSFRKIDWFVHRIILGKHYFVIAASYNSFLPDCKKKRMDERHYMTGLQNQSLNFHLFYLIKLATCESRL